MRLARAQGGQVFAALFELSDPELLAGLVALGTRAHVVLSNGSIQAKGRHAGGRVNRQHELGAHWPGYASQ
jgi:hypothetical protein